MRALPFSELAATGTQILVTIQRGLTALRFTSAENDVTIGGNTWIAAGGARLTSVQENSDGTPTNADIQIATKAGGIVEPGDGVRGILDGWPIKVEMFSIDDPSLGTFELIKGAVVGSVAEDTNGIATIAADGQMNRARAPVTEHFSLSGREDLGDDRCKVPIMPADIGRGVAFVRPDIATGLQRVNDAYGRFRMPSTGSAGTPADYNNLVYQCIAAGTTDPTTAPAYPLVAGGTVTDGTAQFVAVNSFTRHATGQATGTFVITLDALPDPRASDPTWFVLGALYVRSGNLNGYPKLPIRAWDPGTLEVTLFLPVLETDIPAATQLEIHAGCDLTREICFSKFNDIVNLRAETFVPPPDVNF